MGNQERLQRGDNIERMGRILIDIDGRTFQEMKDSPRKVSWEKIQVCSRNGM